jgi:HEAT repeat protein
MKANISSFCTLASLASAASLCLITSGAAAEDADYVPSVHAGRAAVYEQLPENSLEHVSTPDSIMAVTLGNTAPTEIWRTLEHAERVECLGCIPAVSKMLYSNNKKTREISAWWLRRRIFGVFGAGQIYPTLLDTISKDGSEQRRAYAAEALGEFLLASGVPAVAKAATADASPVVRLSAVHALDRLNTQGPNGELATAIGDEAADVRLAAIEAAVHVHVFTGVDAVVARLSDTDADVRRRAAEALGSMAATDAVVGLIAITSPDNEKDARVRTAAVAALGRIADPSAKDAVEAAQSDSDPFVVSMARIALRRL